METFSISVPEKKSDLVKQLLKELGVKINVTVDAKKSPNRTTIASMKKTSEGKGLSKSSSHEDLMEKLNS